MQLPLVLLLLCSLRCVTWVSSQEPVVRVAQGDLRGRRVERPAGSPLRSFYAFEGIPFARPPVGDLRFKDPQEVQAWTGIRNATAYGPKCIQKGERSGISGAEDCLYLNVYTPPVSNPPENWITLKRPVLIFIHPGAFTHLSGNLENMRADPILLKDIIFVTMNYRLGVMGFLNTEDSQAPGNAGLKDQTMALRWVQRNIAAFGGDRNNVTIMGESAGGASVHYHLLSPLSRGLFRGAIAMSGNALPTWASQQQPREKALALRRMFTGFCPELPEDAIVRCLQQVNAQELVFNQYDVPLQPYQNYFLKNTFLPSVEAASSSDSPFLTAEPQQLMMEGNYTRVPFMTSFTSADGIILLEFANLIRNTSGWAAVEEHFEEIFRWELPPGHRTLEAARQLRQFYLGDRSLRDAHQNNDTLRKFVQLSTDTFFAAGIASTARLMAAHGTPVYVYQFSRDGPIAFMKNIFHNASHIPGVTHGDDMAYLFDFIVRATGEPRPVPSSEQPLRERQVQLFANFVKYGNPTPEESGVHWPLFTADNETYLDINRELSALQPVLGERENFWRSLANANYSAGGSITQINA